MKTSIAILFLIVSGFVGINERLKDMHQDFRIELNKIGRTDIYKRPCRPWDACVDK